MDGTLDMSMQLAMLQSQKQTLEAAKARKGQKPSSKATRMELAMEFSIMRLQSANMRAAQGPRSRQYFINHAYPPANVPVSELVPMAISDLRLETHHRGKVLFVRAFGHPVRISGIQNAVEDEAGGVDRLSVYNVDALLKAEQLLPKDAIFAIKEPYYKSTADGGVSLRVDHPSDLIRLQPLDPLVPAALCPCLLALDKTAFDWKKEGNTAYAKKDYLEAIYTYTQALLACDAAEQTLRSDIYRNRAMVNLCLKRSEHALKDAIRSVDAATTPEDVSISGLDAKAYYRAGRAAYELGRYSEAEAHYKSSLALTPDDKDSVREIKRVADRVAEAISGSYDFNKMSRSASRKHNRLDHASFTSGTIRDAGKRGRGLFATKDVKAGELVLCEKAFSVAFDSEEAEQTFMILNLNTGKGSFGTQATLLFNTVQNMLHSSAEAATFLKLHDGGYTPKCTAPEVDGVTVIDTFQTQAIIEHNCFGCPTVRSTSKEAQVQAAKDGNMASSGMWVTASYINHACDGNATRSFIGDMMIIRATKDIAKGQEILMPYRLADADVGVTQKELQKSWGFQCDCAICTTDAKSSASQRKQRAALVNEAEQLAANHKPTAQYTPSANITAKMEKLYAQSQRTYEAKLFQDRPRTALVALGIWLCNVYAAKTDPAKTTTTAIDVLKNLGYGVTVNGQDVRFEHTNCHLQGGAVDAAMYASQASYVQGKSGAGAKFGTFAKLLYQTLYGEMRGFDERYGSG